jgi:hypothetical protein
MKKRKLTPRQVRWLMLETMHDERTVKNWAAGAQVRPATAARLEQAVAKMPKGRAV